MESPPQGRDNRAPTPEPIHSARIDRIAGSDARILSLIQQLVEISIEGLPLMYRRDREMFAHTRRRVSDTNIDLQGTSFRYSAIVLLGVQWLDEERQRRILGGESAAEFCSRLCGEIDESSNLGDLALTTWTAAALGIAETRSLAENLSRRVENEVGAFTVEVAWALSALTAAHAVAADAAHRTCARLLASLPGEFGVFPHQVDGKGEAFRSHVGCFADQVYPIQALSRYHKVFGDSRALDAANRCAEMICRLQGPRGEWWWHYDVRTGGVVEGYPVYSVHQDSMAPMALLDLAEAGGIDFAEPIRRGLVWLQDAPVAGNRLIDDANLVIWRKLGRREPKKLVRQLNAVTTSLNSGFRLPGIESIFPPVSIDWESRPYHLGWVLDSWLGRL